RALLADRAARRAGAVESADPLQHRLGLGRRAGGAAVARDRRDRLRAAEDRPAARGARHAVDLSQQRDPVVAGRRDRRGHERAGGLMDDVARTGCTRHGKLAPLRRCDRAAWRLVVAFAIVAAPALQAADGAERPSMAGADRATSDRAATDRTTLD